MQISSESSQDPNIIPLEEKIIFNFNVLRHKSFFTSYIDERNYNNKSRTSQYSSIRNYTLENPLPYLQSYNRSHTLQNFDTNIINIIENQDLF